jgi:RHS repeat-associated protein
LTRYGFTGRERDEATGLLYYRDRWYDPQQGRFLTEDPIGFGGGLNTYEYAGNNPLSFTDPTGQSLQSFLNGFWSSFVVSAVVSAAVAAVIAASGGTVAAVIAGLLAVYGGYQLYKAIEELATQNLCQDEYDQKLGELLGSILGGMLGGGVGARVGGGLGGGTSGIKSTMRNVLVDESGSMPGRVPGDYLVGKAPTQVTPGTRTLRGQYQNDLGRIEPWEAHYDQYGRLIGRTDMNAGNKAAGIPDVHHMVREYSSQYPRGRDLYKHGKGPYGGGSAGLGGSGSGSGSCK